MKKTNRREFVKGMSSLALGAGLVQVGCKEGKEDSKSAESQPKSFPKRRLGKTGEEVSILTLGGYHLGDRPVPDVTAIEIIRNAIDAGINFMDNAWYYFDGRSETLMGQALQDGYRDKVLLMTKFNNRTLDGIKKQLEDSLKRLRVDSFDLMQFHSVGDRDGDVDLIYNNKLPEWAEEMRSQGVFKYIGFTGHADPKTLRDMIERGFPWDTMQMVINPGDHHRNVSFEEHVLPLAVEKDIGVIAMKTNAFGRISKSGLATAADGIRYALSLPVSTVCSGMDSLEILEENLKVYHHYTPMEEEEKSALLARFEGKSDMIATHRKKVYSEDQVEPN